MPLLRRVMSRLGAFRSTFRSVTPCFCQPWPDKVNGHRASTAMFQHPQPLDFLHVRDLCFECVQCCQILAPAPHDEAGVPLGNPTGIRVCSQKGRRYLLRRGKAAALDLRLR